MEECEKEIIFYHSGRVKGKTKRAQEAIDILNLDNDILRNRRKKAIRDLLYAVEYYPPEEDINEWDEELLTSLVNKISVSENGRLAPFAPVLINICRDIMK